MIDAKAPNTDSITNRIPKDECVVEMDKKELIQVIKRITSFRNTTTNGIIFDFNCNEDNEITVIAENIDYAKAAKEVIPVLNIKNMAFKTSLNSLYLQNVLNGLQGNVVKWEQVNEKGMVRITDEKQNFSYYLAPLYIVE